MEAAYPMQLRIETLNLPKPAKVRGNRFAARFGHADIRARGESREVRAQV